MPADTKKLRGLGIVFLGVGISFIGVGAASSQRMLTWMGPSMIAMGLAFIASARPRAR